MIVDEARVAESEHLDPRRWVALLVVLMAAFIVVLDNTVLNVAIPTIRAEFHTTLPSLLWVVTGYALTFATLLIIGGRGSFGTAFLLTVMCARPSAASASLPVMFLSIRSSRNR